MDQEILMIQCPHCAEQVLLEVVILHILTLDHNEYAVSCNNCGARGPNELTEKNAVKMWNMRRSHKPILYSWKEEDEN